jgi:hypothetical protein
MKSKKELVNEIKDIIGIYDFNKRCDDCLIYKHQKYFYKDLDGFSQCLYNLLEYVKKYNETLYNELKIKLSINGIHFFPCDSSDKRFDKAVEVILNVLNVLNTNELDIE